MASQEYPDPVADWFQRHRVALALILFVGIMLGRAPRLLEGTTGGIVGFGYAAAFFGLLTWSLASRQDRSDAAYWRRFAILWTVFLTLQIAMIVASLAVGNDFQGRWLVPTVIVALLALIHWLPYYRIKGGKPFPTKS